MAGAVISAGGLLATLFLPAVDLSHGIPGSAGEQLLEAEMTTLRPDDEPVAVSD
jgi:hypothetical protein